MADLLQPLVVAAPRSGSGKTIVALGLMAALKSRGYRVAPFKVGPDYIDPGYHEKACGEPSRNLDGWMCGRGWVTESYVQGSRNADIALIEGVMGLFDGADGHSDAGSTAEIARWLRGRVLLVVDAAAQARSAAALVQGFARFDERLEFAGIVFNRVGSERHRQLLQEAMESVGGLPPVLGHVPRDDSLALPERHLGLVTAAESGLDDVYWNRLANWMEQRVDVSGLIKGRQVPTGDLDPPAANSAPPPVGRKVKIGVAKDEAFCFCYPDNLELLERAGAELVFFSPLRDRSLPDGVRGIILPGGYPELAAEQLSENRPMLGSLNRAAAESLPIYAECGGFMLLAESIDEYPMAGVFPGAARMLPRRKALGYREATLTADTVLGPAGTTVRGHEFHYSEFDLPGEVERCYRLNRPGSGESGREGFRIKNTLGSYVHLHFGSNPQVAVNFVEFCLENTWPLRHRDTEKFTTKDSV